ncbi:MAG: GGDEF domain-containing protein, partial [Thermoleophilia bacterium]|nr:GGDEF domain-containing protein [Thermoleophilia bacterium]
EFAVIAPHTTSQEAEALARRVETAIAEGFAEFDLTVCIGIASYPKDTTDPAQLRVIADRRLYELKDGIYSERENLH